MQIPGPNRPHLPLRWSQLALETVDIGMLVVRARTLYLDILASPVSMT